MNMRKLVVLASVVGAIFMAFAATANAATPAQPDATQPAIGMSASQMDTATLDAVESADSPTAAKAMGFCGPGFSSKAQVVAYYAKHPGTAVEMYVRSNPGYYGIQADQSFASYLNGPNIKVFRAPMGYRLNSNTYCPSSNSIAPYHGKLNVGGVLMMWRCKGANGHETCVPIAKGYCNNIVTGPPIRRKIPKPKKPKPAPAPQPTCTNVVNANGSVVIVCGNNNTCVGINVCNFTVTVKCGDFSVTITGSQSQVNETLTKWMHDNCAPGTPVPTPQPCTNNCGSPPPCTQNCGPPPCTSNCGPPPCTQNCSPPPAQAPSLSNLTVPEEIFANGEGYPNIRVTASAKNGDSITVSCGAHFGSMSGSQTFTSGGVDTLNFTYTAPSDAGSIGQTESITCTVHDNTNGLNGSGASVSFTIKAPPPRPLTLVM